MKHVQSVGDGVSTAYTVTHNFHTRDVAVQLYANSGYEEIEALVVHETADTVVIEFASAPATNAYRVVVLHTIRT